MNILITGVSGYIGSELVIMLCKDKHCLVGIDKYKKEDITEYLDQFIEWDLSNKDSKLVINNEIDIIIHLAGEADTRAASGKHIKNNLDASMNLIKYAKLAKVKKIIFLSSNKTGLPGSYGLTKSKIEEELKKLADNFDIKYTILRSAAVYGTSMQSRIANWIKKIQKANIPALPATTAVTTMIGIHDLCTIINICMHDEITDNKIYEVSDGYPYNINEIERLARRHFQRDRTLLTIPRWFLFILAKIGDLLTSLNMKIPINSESYRSLFLTVYTKSDAFNRETGFFTTQNFLNEIPVIFRHQTK